MVRAPVGWLVAARPTPRGRSTAQVCWRRSNARTGGRSPSSWGRRNRSDATVPQPPSAWGLLLAAALSVYKPRGMTRYGWQRRQRERDGNLPATARTVTGVEIARTTQPDP